MRMFAKRWACAAGMGVLLGGTMGASAAPVRLHPGSWRAPSPRPDVATWVGEARIHTDGEGRLAIVLDEAQGRSVPDGSADHLFLFETETPILEAIDEHVRSARVILTGTTLHLISTAPAFFVDLALAGGADARREMSRAGIVLHDGIALQSRNLVDPAQTLETLRTEGYVLVETPGPVEATAGARPWCDSGGNGSQSCSYSCSMSSASISRADGCSISCAPGFYACCGCNWLYKAHCSCIREPVKDDREFGADR